MKQPSVLRKAIIKEKISNSEYLVEDILDGSLINMRISGKQRMLFFRIEIGIEVYVECSPCDTSKGRMVTSPTEFKMDQNLLCEKHTLDNIINEMKNKKENEINQGSFQDVNEGTE